MRSMLLFFGLLCQMTTSCFVGAAAQNLADYDASVKQGKAQLQAGSNDAALASANAAIKLDGTRWEAYAVAGGALINLKRYDDAAGQLGHAIAQAPDAKQAGLRDLLKQCETLKAAAASASSGGASGPGPSYAETVRYIQDKIRAASYPTPTIQLDGLIGNSLNKWATDYTVTFDDAKYTFAADGCESMTFTATVTTHMDDLRAERHWAHKEGQRVHSYTVPFKSVASIPERPQVAAIYSTHEITQTVLGGLMGDGRYLSNNWPEVMIEQLPPTFAFGGDHQDWHDALWIVPKDLNVSWTNFDNVIESPNLTGGGPENQSGNITKSGLPILMIRFVKPGTGAESPHVAKAIQHLVELCAAHPEQAPKELF
jgi:hypothetical protein